MIVFNPPLLVVEALMGECPNDGWKLNMTKLGRKKLQPYTVVRSASRGDLGTNTLIWMDECCFQKHI